MTVFPIQTNVGLELHAVFRDGLFIHVSFYMISYIPYPPPPSVDPSALKDINKTNNNNLSIKKSNTTPRIIFSFKLTMNQSIANINIWKKVRVRKLKGWKSYVS